MTATQLLISSLTTSIASIIGVVTNSIISIRAHSQTTQSVLAAQNPTGQIPGNSQRDNLP